MTTTTHGGVGNAVAEVLTIIVRSMRLTRRNLDTLVISIVLPLLLMLL